MEEEMEPEVEGRRLEDLPEELLDNIFSRLSPYSDLPNLKQVSRRLHAIATTVVANMQANWEQALLTGHVDCHVLAPTINDQGHIVPPGSWISERFGHVAVYYDKSIYIVGGTTHTPTTFNDMWRFSLSSSQWSRCIGSGQYPSPKALASALRFKDNLVLFGGWSHPCPYPLMQPWKLFDELHVFNFTSNKWTQVITSTSPPPSAGHSGSLLQNKMVIFGGRTFNSTEQSYPLSNAVWTFDFDLKEWFPIRTSANKPSPMPRYGQTQVTIDTEHILIVGGCGGPNQIFSDVWLLQISNLLGVWHPINVTTSTSFTPMDFHYSGVKVGSTVVFFERSSPISPFLGFLHFDTNNQSQGQGQGPPQHQGLPLFEPTGSRHFHANCQGLRSRSTSRSSPQMAIYTLDVSEVTEKRKVSWKKETLNSMRRPGERLLYSMVGGRAELILFGGFYKDPNGQRCRVSNELMVIRSLHKSY